MIRCLWKRREVVLEQMVFHEQRDLWFTPPPLLVTPITSQVTRCYPPPLLKCQPPLTCHPTSDFVTPTSQFVTPPSLLTLSSPSDLSPPRLTCHPLWLSPRHGCHPDLSPPPLLAAVHGDGGSEISYIIQRMRPLKARCGVFWKQLLLCCVVISSKCRWRS